MFFICIKEFNSWVVVCFVYDFVSDYLVCDSLDVYYTCKMVIVRILRFDGEVIERKYWRWFLKG